MATYILFWNPAISSYSENRFLNDFHMNAGVGNWSFNEYEKVQPGDIFYMVRCGEGNVGVVMKGNILTNAYESEDWSPKNRPNIHYADIYQTFTINSFSDVKLLTPDELTKEIPDFNWFGGHSGRLLDEEDAKKLDSLWENYLEKNPNLVRDGFAFKNEGKYNTLLQYLVQCRAEEFESEFILAVEKGLKWEDEVEGYPIFAYAAALRELLTENKKSSIFEFARDGNDRIWELLNNQGFIPDDYKQRLIDYANEYNMYSVDDSYEYILDYPLEELEKRGDKKIDCDLYVAASIFNFDETKRLLELGANPDALLAKEEGEYEDGTKWFESQNIKDYCAEYWGDVFEPCAHIVDTWKRGMDKEDEPYAERTLFQAIISSVYKMMYDLLDEYSNN